MIYRSPSQDSLILTWRTINGATRPRERWKRYADPKGGIRADDVYPTEQREGVATPATWRRRGPGARPILLSKRSPLFQSTFLGVPPRAQNICKAPEGANQPPARAGSGVPLLCARSPRGIYATLFHGVNGRIPLHPLTRLRSDAAQPQGCPQPLSFSCAAPLPYASVPFSCAAPPYPMPLFHSPAQARLPGQLNKNWSIRRFILQRKNQMSKNKYKIRLDNTYKKPDSRHKARNPV